MIKSIFLLFLLFLPILPLPVKPPQIICTAFSGLRFSANPPLRPKRALVFQYTVKIGTVLEKPQENKCP